MEGQGESRYEKVDVATKIVKMLRINDPDEKLFLKNQMMRMSNAAITEIFKLLRNLISDDWLCLEDKVKSYYEQYYGDPEKDVNLEKIFVLLFTKRIYPRLIARDISMTK